MSATWRTQPKARTILLEELYQFYITNWQEMLGQLGQHLFLTGVAIFIASGLGVPTGLLLTRSDSLSGPVLGFTGVLQTIPSLALLGFLIPFTGIGEWPGIIALFLYALLPIVRNAYTGVVEVDPAVREAAYGMGMRDRQVLSKVELPLALPVLFAGIRTATVITVGIATLAALVGAGGLGVYIFRGISLNNSVMILAGALPAAALALVLDGILAIIQKFIRSWGGYIILLLFLVAAGAILWRVIPGVGGGDKPTIGMMSEFMERPDGFKGLKKTYNLTVQPREMMHGLKYQALKQGRLNAIIGYSTDGEIARFGFHVLEDDKNYFPPYEVAPLVRLETLEQYPQIADILNKLGGKLSNETMADLNARMDDAQTSARSIASDWLQQQGFRTDRDNKGTPDIVIGSKVFAEQYILAEMFGLLIENYSDLNVKLNTGLGGTQICFTALEEGDIDLYPEYSGTAFINLLEVDPELEDSLIRKKDALFDFTQQALQQRYEMQFLSPLGFNNTYAVVLPGKFKGKLSTISQWQQWLQKQQESEN